MRGRFKTDNTVSALIAAHHGLGLGCVPLWQIRDFVAEGGLEIVLDAFEPPPIPIYGVFPSSGMLPAKTCLFLDLLARKLKDERR